MGMGANRTYQKRSIRFVWLLVAGAVMCAAAMLSLERAAHAAAEDGEARVNRDKIVYLTFDDGPSRHTPEVLDILKEEGIPATFFVLGQSALAQEDMIRRIVDEGHALGNHTYDHDYEKLYPRFIHFWDQIQQTEEVLAHIVGIRPSLVRAPGGTYKKFDAHYFRYMEEAGYQVHDWNVDSGDSKRKGVPARDIVANVKNAPLRDVMNVLLHDGAGHAESVLALPEIIAYFKEQGYRFAPLTEDVEPIQFRIADELKERSMALEDHEAIMKRIGARTASISVAVSPEPAPVQLANPSLGIRPSATLHLTTAVASAQGWTASFVKARFGKPLPPEASAEQEDDQGNTGEIGLRAYFEQRGGKVEWWSHARKAVIRYRGLIYEFEPEAQWMRVYQNGVLQKASQLEGMRIKDGAIRIPARHTQSLPRSLNLWNGGNARYESFIVNRISY